jgi:hypothetical protein
MTKHNGMDEWLAAEVGAELAHLARPVPPATRAAVLGGTSRQTRELLSLGTPARVASPGALSAAEWNTLTALTASPAGSATTKALTKITDLETEVQDLVMADLSALGLVRHTTRKDEVVWNDTPAGRAALQRQADLHPETPSTEIPVSDPRRSSRTAYSVGVAAQAIAENDDLARFPDLARQAVLNCCADWEAGSGPGDLYSFAQGWAAGYARS